MSNRVITVKASEDAEKVIGKLMGRRRRGSGVSNNIAYAKEQLNREATYGINEGSLDGAKVEFGTWSVIAGRIFMAAESSTTSLPPGQYKGVQGYDKFYLEKQDVSLDDLIVLPDTKSDEVINEISQFWGLKEKFYELGFLWKRGVLLWGPPGGGKTSTVQIISNNHIVNNGISVYIDDPVIGAKALACVRQIEPERPIVAIMEDIDSMISHYDEADVLALLDGELQIDNVIFIATTNYPEKLDKRIINRPSRFDVIKEIGLPSDEARAVFLKAKNVRLALEENAGELDKWVKATKKMSIAHMKEMIISVEIFGKELLETEERLRKMGSDLPDSTKGSDKGGFGFGG